MIDPSRPDPDQPVVALLRLFTRFANVDALVAMGHSEMPWSLAQIRGLSREAAIATLDRAAAAGILTAHGEGYYSLMSAPDDLQSLFDQFYPGAEGEQARRAFVEAMGELAEAYAEQYAAGNEDVSILLAAEEANLLSARRLAAEYGWWHRVVDILQALEPHYLANNRVSDWIGLLAEAYAPLANRAGARVELSAEKLGSARRRFAVLLARAGLLAEARELAQLALTDLSGEGERTRRERTKAEELIDRIDKELERR